MGIIVKKNGGYDEPFSAHKLARSIALVYLCKKKLDDDAKKRITAVVDTINHDLEDEESITISSLTIRTAVNNYAEDWFKSIYNQPTVKTICETDESKNLRKYKKVAFAKLVERKYVIPIVKEKEIFIDLEADRWQKVFHSVNPGVDIIFNVGNSFKEVDLLLSDEVAIDKSVTFIFDSNKEKTMEYLMKVVGCNRAVKLSGHLMMAVEDEGQYKLFSNGEEEYEVNALRYLNKLMLNSESLLFWDNAFDTTLGASDEFTFAGISPSTGAMLSNGDKTNVLYVDLMKAYYKETKTFDAERLDEIISSAVIIGNFLFPLSEILISPLNLDKLCVELNMEWGSGKSIIMFEVIMNIFRNACHIGSAFSADEYDYSIPELTQEITSSLKFKSEHFPLVAETIEGSGMYNVQSCGYCDNINANKDVWKDFRYPIEAGVTIQRGCDGAVPQTIIVAPGDVMLATMYAWKCGLKLLTLKEV